MNTKIRKLGTLITSLALVAGLSLTATNAAFADDAGTQGQKYADLADTNNGGWSNSTAGVAGRPYITALSIDDNSVMTGTPTSPTDEMWAGDVRAAVYAFNTCRTNQQPADGVCYANPNRIGIVVGYGNQDSLGTNWSSTNGATHGITESSVIDVTIQMNSFASSLGWTWLNGEPSYWAVDPVAGTVHLKFKPRIMPSTMGIDNHCTTIPVSTCDTDQAAAELLVSSMVLSVDTTNDVFKGTLFATAGAVMGSLETGGGFNPNNPSSNSLTYGMAAPHRFAADYTAPGGSTPGDVRKGVLYGLVPNSLLQAGFGLTDPTQASALLSVTRSSDTTAGGSDTVTWTPWTAADNGTDGQLVTISDITFSAPKFAVKLRGVNNNGGGNQGGGGGGGDFKLGKGKKITSAQIGKGLGIKLAKGEKIVLSVAKKSAKVCAVSGAAIKGLKAGSCSFTATVLNAKGKKVSGKSKSYAFLVG